MQFVTIEELQANAGVILGQLAGNGEVIVTDGGRPVAILTDVMDDDVERSLTALRRARAVAAVESMQDTARETGLDKTSLEEINEEIRAARQTR
jgi:antitoxin (DNA-binding transcriptional repressor) of toxin-antitoxin stability system